MPYCSTLNQFPVTLPAGTLCQAIWPFFNIYSVAASSVFSIPFWRHFIAWLGSVEATPANFKRILKKGSVAVIVGGIAEMYMQVEAVHTQWGRPYQDNILKGHCPGRVHWLGPRDLSPMKGAGSLQPCIQHQREYGMIALSHSMTRYEFRNCTLTCLILYIYRRPSVPPPSQSTGSHHLLNVRGVSCRLLLAYLQHKRKERIMLLNRKGFVKIAVESGLDGGIIPVYHYGNTQVGPWAVCACTALVRCACCVCCWSGVLVASEVEQCALSASKTRGSVASIAMDSAVQCRSR